jgi:hypothetical protein
MGKQAIATASITGRSKCSAAVDTGTPPTAAVAPITVNVLKILLPTTLPTAMSCSPR